MALQAVLFDFNGILINDESVHLDLIADLLLAENLRPDRAQIQRVCLGRSDRAGLQALWESLGRAVTDEYLLELMQRKSEAYRQKLEAMDELPMYPGLNDFILKLRLENLTLGLVSGALRSEVEAVLERVELRSQFQVLVGGDDLSSSKPEPDGYLLAVERLNAANPELSLTPGDCLAIEDSPAGIEAAQRAGMQVVGVANTYPAHMLQRQADWVVDELAELELDRVRRAFETETPTPLAPLSSDASPSNPSPSG